MTSEDFRSSQYLNDTDKQQDRKKKKQEMKQAGIFEDRPGTHMAKSEGAKNAPRQGEGFFLPFLLKDFF